MKRLGLHRRTRQILKDLSQKYGTEIPWMACFAEIAELNEAVRKCFEPAELDQLAILDEPVEVAGTKFYALTLNAEDWFEEFCAKFPDAPEMQTAAWLYASAHSMEPEKLPFGGNKFALAWKVWLWRCRCGVKRAQIAPLQRLLMPETPWPKGMETAGGDVEREGYAGFGWMVTPLCRLKDDPDWWRFKVPFLKAMQCYLNAAMYGEQDTTVREARWEQWRAGAQMEEAAAIKRLKDAWEAWEALCGRSPSPTPAEPPEAKEEASAGEETANPEEAKPAEGGDGAESEG